MNTMGDPTSTPRPNCKIILATGSLAVQHMATIVLQRNEQIYFPLTTSGSAHVHVWGSGTICTKSLSIRALGNETELGTSWLLLLLWQGHFKQAKHAMPVSIVQLYITFFLFDSSSVSHWIICLPFYLPSLSAICCLL